MIGIRHCTVEAASRRLDFEQSRDGSATGSKQLANVFLQDQEI